MGEIGFEGRRDYTAVGNVTNLAARLCGTASVGQILTNQKTLALVAVAAYTPFRIATIWMLVISSIA